MSDIYYSPFVQFYSRDLRMTLVNNNKVKIKSNLSLPQLCELTVNQIENFWPDNDPLDIDSVLEVGIEAYKKLEHHSISYANDINSTPSIEDTIGENNVLPDALKPFTIITLLVKDLDLHIALLSKLLSPESVNL